MEPSKREGMREEIKGGDEYKEYVSRYVGAIINQIRTDDPDANFDEEEVDEEILKELDEDEALQEQISEGMKGKRIERIQGQGLKFHIKDEEMEEVS